MANGGTKLVGETYLEENEETLGFLYGIFDRVYVLGISLYGIFIYVTLVYIISLKMNMSKE